MYRKVNIRENTVTNKKIDLETSDQERNFIVILIFQ